jgi:pimeloyl-ACP methyl ester carboxylesterase
MIVFALRFRLTEMNARNLFGPRLAGQSRFARNDLLENERMKEITPTCLFTAEASGLAKPTNQVVKNIIRRTTFALFLAVQLLILATTTNAQPYQIVNTQDSVVGNNLSKTVTTIQEGNNQLDRFTYAKVKKQIPPQALKGILLVLPPLGSGFQNYEVDENGVYDNSFVAFFAENDFLVAGYSTRQGGLTAGQCESGVVDCSPMANWGLETIGDDVKYVRDQLALEYPHLKIVVLGLSMGSIASAVAIDEHPTDYAGAVMIEGTIYDEDPTVRAINANFCSTFEGMLAGGVYYDGQSGPGFKALNQLAQVAPNAPTVFPGFPPGFTNRQAFILTMSATPLSPVSPRPGYFNAAGSVAEDRFFFVSEPLLHANIATFFDYTPIRALRDLNCGLAGERTFTNNLGSFTGPVLMFAAGHGFGTAMLDTADLMTSADVKVQLNEDFGHVDLMFSITHRKELERRILKWLHKEPFK